MSVYRLPDFAENGNPEYGPNLWIAGVVEIPTIASAWTKRLISCKECAKVAQKLQSTSTESSGLTQIRVRYLERRKLADGSIAYYYCPPESAQRAGVALPAPLGKEPIAAAAKAEEQNRRIDDWRAGREQGRGGPILAP